MTKDNEIRKAINASHYPNFDEIAKKHNTARSYVLSIYSDMDKKEPAPLDAPKFWDPEDEIK